MSDQITGESRTSEISEWVCPYCDQTRQSAKEIREHITESTDGSHRGVDGLKPTEAVLAYGTDGSVVDRIEGVSTEPADPIEDYDKREIIINAWLAAERDPDVDAVTAISGATRQYVTDLIRQLDAGEIRRETYIEVLDYGLIGELEERLENYESEDTTMSTELKSAADIVEETPKKRQIIAAHEVAADSASMKDIANALDSSYEYVRQIFNDIEEPSPEEWEKLREGDLEEELSLNVKEAVSERLRRAGVETVESELDKLREDAVSEELIPQSGAVPVKEIVRVRERIELLREQAEFTDDQEALFVAEKGLSWLDELIEQAE